MDGCRRRGDGRPAAGAWVVADEFDASALPRNLELRCCASPVATDLGVGRVDFGMAAAEVSTIRRELGLLIF